MVQRRRFANRDELVVMLTEHINVNTSSTVDEADVLTVLDALEEAGVNTNALITVTVDEPEPTNP